jgi:hypothetical protein
MRYEADTLRPGGHTLCVYAVERESP